jgi:quinolinate synthase
MRNEITSLATETCEEVYADANAFFDYINSNADVNAMLDALNGTYSNSETLVEVV